MAQFELTMPKMGESIMEATILRWVKNVGDLVEMEENIVEIATDKVDSEVPSPVSGKLIEIRFHENETVEVGKVIAVLETDMAIPVATPERIEETEEPNQAQLASLLEPLTGDTGIPAPQVSESISPSGRFYSPLVRTIAQQENISMQELETMPGTGSQGRVTKKDILHFMATRKTPPVGFESRIPETVLPKPATSLNGQTEIIEMDRMRRLIADHMVMSKHTAPHVTSFIEVDVTEMVKWRDRIKDKFQKQYGEKITFTPIFIEAVAKAIGDFPMINISVDGYTILRKKDINIGMATALPSGNLIVPVIRNADLLNLAGLTKSVNDLANRARANQLRPEEVQGGTFTITNVGGFGNVMGTPIINQPQVAIMAVGAIRKKPAVVETPYGDLIAVRQLMFISLSYDHRVVDGALGGSFLRRVGDYLEAFDPERGI